MHMNSHRGLILAVAVFLVLSLSGWMVYSAIQTSKTTFMAGAPPEEIKKELLPHTVELAQMHPPAIRDTDPVRYGSATSVASVIEFGDFECEACRVMKPILESAVSKFGNRVRFVWRDLPISDAHPNAVDAAIFARCAGIQGKYWEAYDALFASPSLGEGAYVSIARDLKLNLTSLAQCRQDPNMRSALQLDVDTARYDGIDAAPFLFVGTKAFNGAVTSDVIENELKRFISS